MKKLNVILLILPIILLLLGCTQSNAHDNTDIIDFYPGILEFPVEHDFPDNDRYLEVTWDVALSYEYATFEEMMLNEVSHMVIAQYVGSQPFGEMYTEFEFIVSDSLLGETTERIFVYSTNAQIHVHGHNRHVSYVPHDLRFEYGIDYLLPIRMLQGIHLTHPRPGDRFVFARQTFINLDNPAASNMYSEPLNNHMDEMQLMRTTPRATIIDFMSGFVEEIESQNRWQRIYISSDDIYDIITGSPYVFVVELLEFIPLIGSTTWMSVDNFYVNVLEVLKGDPNFWYETRISFAMNTVEVGQQLIVAVQPIGENDNYFWFDLTSTNNSIFEMNHLDEVRAILNQSTNHENNQGGNDNHQGNNNNQGNNQGSNQQ